MKPAPFRYRRAHTIEEAISCLQEFGEGAKILAGGQSLVPMMNLRLANPTALVDINAVRGLSGIQQHDGQLRLGALVRHRHLETYPAPLPGFTLLPKAARFIGHYGVRDRGSLGGSVSHADSTAEWCLMASLYDAEMHLTGPERARVVPVEQFFQGFLSTALEPDEVLTEVRLRKGATHSAIQEFALRHGDFAIVAVAVAMDLREGRCHGVRLVVGGVSGAPFRSLEAEQLLEGQLAGAEMFAEVADVAARSIDPSSDSHASADYRRALTRSLVSRALEDAVTSAPDELDPAQEGLPA
jgi:carbon-monoxide dehydrogenase medium subunit